MTSTACLERVKGIEPSYSAWKAAALPLSYTRNRAAFAPPVLAQPPLKATASEAMRWLPVRQWWRGLDLNQRRHSQRIYSPSPLTTRAPLRTAAGAMQRGINAKRPPGQPIREAPYGGTAQSCQPQQPGNAAKFRRPTQRGMAIRRVAAIEPGHERRQETEDPQRHPLRQAAARLSRPEERRRRAAAPSARASRSPPGETAPDGLVRLYGIHTVRAALDNPRRKITRMLVTRNAAERLEIADLAALPFKAEIVEPQGHRQDHRQRRRAPGRA